MPATWLRPLPEHHAVGVLFLTVSQLFLFGLRTFCFWSGLCRPWCSRETAEVTWPCAH